MRKISMMFFTVVLVLLCLPFTMEAASMKQAAGPASKAAGPAGAKQQSWQAEWEKTLQAAKAEGKVVMYTTAGSDIRSTLTKGMKEKFGLNIDFVTGKGAEMSTKVLNERRAGLFLGDVYMGGSTSTMVNLIPEGVMDVITPEFILPEVGDASKWYGKKLPYIDKEQRLIGFRGNVYWVFTINTTLVKPGELTSFNDLLKPALKGKIVMGDPTIEGGAATFVALASAYLMGPEYIKQLVKQEPFITRDERLITEWAARGKYSVMLGTKPDTITEFIKAGAPLQPIIAREGSMIEPGAGTISVMNRRPNPNATKVFINWLLSREGQTAFSEASGVESARDDVSKAHLDATLVREPGKKYIFGDEEFRMVLEKTVKQSRIDFKPLLK